VTIDQAVILVGGKGTRLGERTANTPKPLVPVGGRPFLEYLLEECSRYGFSEVLLLCGYKAAAIVDQFSGRTVRGMKIATCIETEPAGTAGALYHARTRLADRFLLLNGDSIFDFNWLALGVQKLRGALVRMATAANVPGNRYGRVAIESGRVRVLAAQDASLPINAGVYVVSKEIISHIGSLPASLEVDVLPKLVGIGLVQAEIYRGRFIDIGIHEDLERSQSLVPAIVRRPAVFLDRDGVLNQDLNYVHRPEDFLWIDGARDTIRWLNDNGHYVFVVTNQAGVAHGLYGEEAVQSLHKWVQTDLRSIGAHVDCFQYSPFHPQAVVPAYRSDSQLRKPGAGMILKCLEEWPVAKEASFLIGDKETDLQAAASAGVPGHLFSGGNLFDMVRRILSRNI
jgi:D,D-heptose 1,7-bisphosphate phosphatase